MKTEVRRQWRWKLQGVGDQLSVYVLNPLCNSTLNGSDVAALDFHVPQVLEGCVWELHQSAISILSKATKYVIAKCIHCTEIMEGERWFWLGAFRKERGIGPTRSQWGGARYDRHNWCDRTCSHRNIQSLQYFGCETIENLHQHRGRISSGLLWAALWRSIRGEGSPLKLSGILLNNRWLGGLWIEADPSFLSYSASVCTPST